MGAKATLTGLAQIVAEEPNAIWQEGDTGSYARYQSRAPAALGEMRKWPAAAASAPHKNMSPGRRAAPHDVMQAAA